MRLEPEWLYGVRDIRCVVLSVAGLCCDGMSSMARMAFRCGAGAGARNEAGWEDEEDEGELGVT